MKRQNVLLADHYAEGHHSAFVKLFTKYLVKCGYFVIVAFHESRHEWLQVELEKEGLRDSDYKLVSNNLSRRPVKGWGRFNDAVSVVNLWRDSRSLVQSAERDLNIKIDKVFFAWLDDHLANYLPYHLVDLIFRWTWSGLFFHPRHLYDSHLSSKAKLSSIDNVLRSRNCASVAVHDEFRLSLLSQRIGKSVILFPEIADSTPPKNNFWLAEKIQKEANGRTVIGLVGFESRKNPYLLMQVARKVDPEKFYFVFCGVLHESSFDVQERKAIASFFEEKRQNVLFYPHRINEGGEINAVINAFDIIFLVYRNFKSSSNFSTKAALFRKKVVASNSYWIGNVTQRYKMGEVVEGNSVSETIAAIEAIRTQASNGSDFAHYEAFLQIHGEENLEGAFKQIFP